MGIMQSISNGISNAANAISNAVNSFVGFISNTFERTMDGLENVASQVSSSFSGVLGDDSNRKVKVAFISDHELTGPFELGQYGMGLEEGIMVLPVDAVEAMIEAGTVGEGVNITIGTMTKGQLDKIGISSKGNTLNFMDMFQGLTYEVPGVVESQKYENFLDGLVQQGRLHDLQNTWNELERAQGEDAATAQVFADATGSNLQAVTKLIEKAGEVKLYRGVGDDIFVIGDNGRDVINYKPSNGSITVAAKGGNDLVKGAQGGDIISGGAGNDTLYGNSGHDTIDGDAGRDRIYGGGGNDKLSGGSGHDMVDGGHGHDALKGGAGNDTLKGGAGSDFLIGGDGRNKLIGGGGADVFVFQPGETAVVTDPGVDDMFVLSNIGPNGEWRWPLPSDAVEVVRLGSGKVGLRLSDEFEKSGYDVSGIVFNGSVSTIESMQRKSGMPLELDGYWM